MVRLSNLVAGSLLPLASLAQLAALRDGGEVLLRKGLTVIGFNSTQVERVMKASVATLDPHPYAVDLMDDNWETLLRTGTDNPLSLPLEDPVWMIAVYGPDQISKMFMTAFEATALHNSSESGGTLPPGTKFARLDYGTQTVLPTRFWLWKVPILVIATNDLQDLRFFKIGIVAPFHLQMSNLLANRTLWEMMPKWEGVLAPGGSLESTLIPVSSAWAWYHTNLSRIPSFVLLILSGMLTNWLVGLFHKESEKKPEHQPAEQTRAEQRAELKEKLLKEKAEEDSQEKGAEEEAAVATGVENSGPPAKKRTGRKRN